MDDLLTEVGDVELADVPQMEQVRSRLLEKAQDAYQQLLKTEEDEKEPVLRWVDGKSHGRLGDIREMMGDYGKAEQSYHKSIDQLAPLSAQFPRNADYRRDLVQEPPGTGRSVQEIEPLPGSRARAECSGRSKVSRWQVRAICSIANCWPTSIIRERHSGSGRRSCMGSCGRPSPIAPAEAKQAYRSALSAQERLAKEHRERPAQRAKLGRYLNNLGRFLTQTDRSDEAEKTFLAAFELIRPGAADQISKRWAEKKIPRGDRAAPGLFPFVARRALAVRSK